MNVYLKMISGEELIGKLITDHSDVWVLDKPRVLTVIPDSAGNAKVSLLPLMMFNQDGEIQISKHLVIARSEIISKSLEDIYMQATSRIQIASHL